MNILIKDGREKLFQWDTGRVLVVDEPCDYVHFSNMPYGKALTVDVVEGEASIPDELLQSGASLYCYIFLGSVQEGYTEKSVVFEVEKKPKPTDYVFTKTEYITLQDLDSRVKNLEEQGGIGFSPEVEIFPIENGHRVQITDAEGIKSFDVLNGKDGYTPQKGVDYYTEEEKKELVDELSASLPEGGGVSEWDDIKNKPGDIVTEEELVEIAKTVISEVSDEFAPLYDFFVPASKQVNVSVGDKMYANISIDSPSEPAYMEGEVVDVEGSKVAVFNSSQDPYEIMGSLQFIKNDASLPALMVIYTEENNKAEVTVYADSDYTGYNFVVGVEGIVSRPIKLPNDALDLDEIPAKDSEKPITSGGTFTAIEEAKKATEDLGKTVARVFVATTRIELSLSQLLVYNTFSHSFAEIKAAYESGQIVYLKSTSGVYTAPLVYMSSAAALFALDFESAVPGKYNTAFIKLNESNAMTYTVVQENIWVSSVNGKTGVVTIPEPFKITATADFANSALTDVSKTFAEISTAYVRGDHIFIELDISQMMPGWKTTVPLTTFSENEIIFTNIVYTGSPMMGYCRLTSDGSSYVTMMPLASQSDIEDINSALDAINGEVI